MGVRHKPNRQPIRRLEYALKTRLYRTFCVSKKSRRSMWRCSGWLRKDTAELRTEGKALCWSVSSQVTLLNILSATDISVTFSIWALRVTVYRFSFCLYRLEERESLAVRTLCVALRCSSADSSIDYGWTCCCSLSVSNSINLPFVSVSNYVLTHLSGIPADEECDC